MEFGKRDLRALAELLEGARQYRIVIGGHLFEKTVDGKRTVKRIGEKKAGAPGQLHSLEIVRD